MPAATTADQQAQLAVALKQNKSVLDYVEGSVQRMSARAPAAEKVRLQSHLDGLRELEMRFAQMPGGPSAKVMLPDQAALNGLVVNDTTHHKAIVEGFLGLAKAAFGFDRTRVATLMFASGHNWVTFKDYVPAITQSGRVHEITHQSYAQQESRPSPHHQLVRRHPQHLRARSRGHPRRRWKQHARQHAHRVLQRGLDHRRRNRCTARPKNTPLAVIGGKNLGHVGGRCLRYTTRTTNDFWTTVGRQLGLDQAYVMGNPGDNHGGLPELFPA